MFLVDLTHTFGEPMPVWPGDPPAALAATARMQGCPLYEFATGMHVGTHLDAPLHFIPDGANIAELDLERLIGRGVLIDARERVAIDVDLLWPVEVRRGDLVLVLTGASARFHEASYYQHYPEVSEAFARALVKAGASVLGLDTPSPDRSPFPIHKILLGGGVLILENLTNLEALLTARRIELFALPARLQAEAAPARVVARVWPAGE